MARRYGCAVWGCGWVASGHINAYLKHPQCDLVALGSRNAASVRNKQAEFGLETPVYTTFSDLLADPDVDVVSICTPNYLHASETIAAARAGKHIFIEKPVATTPEDIQSMLAAVRETGVRTMVGFVLRFNPLVDLQRRLVAEGELGKVFMLNVDYWFGRERLGWMKDQEKAGGAFILAGCHSVDMARYILGEDICEVRGAEATVGTHYGYPPVETAQVRYANGAIGAFTCALEGCSPYTANVAVLGEKGTIKNDQFFLKRFEGQTDYFSLDTGVKKTGDVYGHPFPAMVEHFVECLENDCESPHNLADAVNAHLCCIAIRKSAELGGKRIRIEGGELVT